MEPPPVQYVRTSDGYDIAYCVSGAGVPLVYMPNPNSHIQLFWRTNSNFRLLFERLSERFKLICYDSRGLGSSTRGLGETHRSEDFEVDLETVVDHLGLHRFALMAQNNFGRVAMNYAARSPNRVVALVLFNTDLGDVPEDRSYKPTQLETLATTNWEMYIETMVRTNWRTEDPELARRFLRESTTAQDWLIRVHAWTRYNALDALPRLRLPTLLIAKAAGELSSTETVSRFIASQIPGSRLAVFDGADGGLFSLVPEPPPAIKLIEDVIRDATSGETSAPSRARPLAELSRREVEVLRLIARGLSNQQMADELVISVRTVERHINHIYTKLGVHNRAQAAAYAVSRRVPEGTAI
jgi:DNA-binding CsgD family transcriptional regulator/pimeloyl-ACP methyl ester carboxylesterase